MAAARGQGDDNRVPSFRHLMASLLPVPSSAPRRGLQRSEHRLVLLAGDWTSALAAVFAALWAWSLTTGFAFNLSFIERSWMWWLIAPAWVALVRRSRQMPRALSIEAALRSIAGASAVLMALYLAIYFYAPRGSLPRLPALYFLWEATILVLAWRLAYLFVFTRAGFRRRVVVVGRGTAASRIVTLLRDVSYDVEVLGVLDDDEPAETIAFVPVFRFADLDKLVKHAGVTEIVLGRPEGLAPAVVQALLRYQEQGVSVVPLSVEYEHLLMRVPVEHLEDGWMFTSLPEWIRARDASSLVKRLFDVVGAFAGAIVLVGLTPLVSCLVVLESGFPVSYRQVRLGAGGRCFRLFKFRTMVQDAEQTGPRWAAEDDHRVTRVGYWLRRSRLDELPQVLNVLRGDMSLVGPRPERPEFAEQLERVIPFYRARLMIAPGLTGWAQVQAPYGASVDDARVKLEYDLYYIKHRSLWFDLRILAKTAGTVLGFSGR